ncbi:sialate O-acetylesterase [Rhizobium sp. WYJ-E13]|uniref:sialate O-acetylesterase n=1 Tax=Rhizobium sp. WYJ-E13 TaxID=2849093 RepID=UPI001C1F1322|nr:sialate O-acetylesterase [Rhizobium sp. WYJ-E13]QWW67947.1 sialate O-acetylesterase [Rhizobium sp. WYJ-E13]
MIHKWWSSLRSLKWDAWLGIALVPVMLFVGAATDYHRNPIPKAYYIAPPQSVIPGADPFLDLTDRVEVPTGNLARTAVLVFVGQTSVNNIPTPYVPVNGNIDQLNIYDGKLYRAKDPLLGINVAGSAVTDKRGTWMMRMADKLIADGHYDRVILVPMAVGATRVDQWADPFTWPFLGHNISVVGRRMRDAGLPCTAIMWGQGESDTIVNTPEAFYAASLQKVIAEFKRVIPGCPFLVAREAYFNGKTNRGVLAAQASVVDNQTVFAGEDVESIGSADRYDNTQLNEAGAEKRATLAVAALKAALDL